MDPRRIIAATHKGLGGASFPPEEPGSGVRRLLAATQRGLGLMAGAPRPVAPTIAPPPVIPVGTPDAGETAGPAPDSSQKREPLIATKAGLASVRVMMATGLFKTASGLLGQQALKEHSAALRLYLTLLTRDPIAAVRGVAALVELLEQGAGSEVALAPTKRAGLFLAARNHVEYERMFNQASVPALSAVPWHPTPPGRPAGWGRALDEVRFGLGDSELEILVLRAKIGLTHEELAYVLAAPRDEVLRRLDAAMGYVRILLDDVFDDGLPNLDELLRDAFAIDASTASVAITTRPHAAALPPGTLIGERYEIEATLGGGEFANVYRARDVRVPGHVVALKLLHRRAHSAAAREGAMRELSLIASAFHPSIVQFKDHGWHDERLWFVMPFYEGETLLQRLEQGPLPVDAALRYFERLARGLATLHAAGIRHQDIKPENIFLVHLRTGTDAERAEILPILLDLGVAAPSGEMALAGTPLYFPPEVAGRILDDGHEAPLSPKADVFALALSFLHAIEPVDPEDLEAARVETFLRRRAQSTPSGPHDSKLAYLGPRLARWLALDPSARPTAAELAEEFAELRRSAGGRRAPRTLKRKAVVLGACATALISGFAAGTTWGGAPHESSRVLGSASSAEVDVQSHLSERRLETERRRVRELEEALRRARQHELGVTPATSE